MIIKTLSTEEMMHDLICDEYARWTPQGARALVNHLQDMSDDIGEDIIWDRVALRCDFSEYESWDMLRSDYDLSMMNSMNMLSLNLRLRQVTLA